MGILYVVYNLFENIYFCIGLVIVGISLGVYTYKKYLKEKKKSQFYGIFTFLFFSLAYMYKFIAILTGFHVKDSFNLVDYLIKSVLITTCAVFLILMTVETNKEKKLTKK